MNSKIDTQIKQIANRYMTALRKDDESYLSSGKEDDLNLYRLYLLRIQRAFSKLNELEKLVINNEYFFNDYYGWWEEIFTKKFFFKYKNKVAKKFVRYVYENI